MLFDIYRKSQSLMHAPTLDVSASALEPLFLLGRALRAHQWSKNMLMFVPAILAGAVDSSTLSRVAIGFLALSLTASGLYLINDLCDIHKDRAHPFKKNRPVATGAISIRSAAKIAAVSILLGLGFASVLDLRALTIVAGYGAASLTYTFVIKKMLLADVMALAVLYSFRIFAGGAIAKIAVSEWLVVFSIFFFLGLSLMKRIIDLMDGSQEASQKTAVYRSADVPVLQALGIAASITSLAVLALYISSDRGHAMYTHANVLWGCWLAILYCVSRLWVSALRGEVQEDPVAFALKATFCQVSVALSIVLLFLARLA
jgi:4-hydroxybenzoate polyprenyltransferase